MSKSKVYFIKDITPENIIKAYEALGKKLPGKVAVDQACLDLVYNSTDPGKDKLIKRIESLHGVHTVEAAADLGVGSRDYELITLE